MRPSGAALRANSIQICRQISREKRGEGEDAVAGLVQVHCGGREIGLQGGHDLSVLGADGGGVGLLEGGADERGDSGLG